MGRCERIKQPKIALLGGIRQRLWRVQDTSRGQCHKPIPIAPYDLNIGHRDAVAGWGGLPAIQLALAEQRPHADQQQSNADGFDHVVVDAGLQPPDPFPFTQPLLVIKSDDLQSIPNSLLGFANGLAKRLIRIDFTDWCFPKIQVGTSSMPPTDVVLWFLFTTSGIPRNRHF